MNTQHSAIAQCLTDLSTRPYIDKKVLALFLNRLNGDNRLVRDEGVTSHFCTFFTPVSLSDRKIFLGHHKKSDSWISPGGHLDKDETPVQTVIRETGEELSYTIQNEKIELFGLTYFPITNRPQCTDHFDLWFLIFFNSTVPFVYEKREFYDAGWFTIKEALVKKSLPEFTNELRQLSTYLKF